MVWLLLYLLDLAGGEVSSSEKVGQFRESSLRCHVCPGEDPQLTEFLGGGQDERTTQAACSQ